ARIQPNERTQLPAADRHRRRGCGGRRPPPYRKRRDIVIYTVAAFYGHHLQPNARKLRGERDVHDALCPYSVQLLGHEYVYHPARTDYRHADRVWTCVYFQLCDPTQLVERAGVL